MPKAPLELVLCNPTSGGCSLIQLRHTVPRDLLFRHYRYHSGMNRSMTLALQDVTNNAERLIRLSKGDIVVDVGVQ